MGKDVLGDLLIDQVLLFLGDAHLGVQVEEFGAEQADALGPVGLDDLAFERQLDIGVKVELVPVAGQFRQLAEFFQLFLVLAEFLASWP